MTIATPLRQEIRIPNLPIGAMTKDDGQPTDDELTFRQILITNLQKLFGNEGVILPHLTAEQVTIVQNHKLSDGITYTCQYGTQIYNSTTNRVMIAINNGSNAPIFWNVTLTAP